MELFVDAEAAQAVGVCELAQSSELFGAKRSLQFVGNLDEGHAAIIASPWSVADGGIIYYRIHLPRHALTGAEGAEIAKTVG